MPRDLVTVATWPNTEEAHAAKNYLADNGIRAVLGNEQLVGNLWHLGNATGWVKLDVEEANAERARTLLRDAPARHAGPPSSDWRCANCRESVPKQFEVCWKCGAERGDATSSLDPTFQAEIDEEAPQDSEANDDFEPPEISKADDQVRRAWFASILGFIVLFPIPLLHCYSIWLLLTLEVSPQSLPPRARRRYYAAITVDLIAAVVVTILARVLFT